MRRQRLEISSMFTSSMRFNHVIIYINMKLTLQTPRPFFTRTKQHLDRVVVNMTFAAVDSLAV